MVTRDNNLLFGSLLRNVLDGTSTITSSEVLSEGSSKFRPYSGIEAQPTMKSGITQRPPKKIKHSILPRTVNSGSDSSTSSKASKNPDRIFRE